MNRIILIGNGFDRSLGMPTGYSHFLDWLFLKMLKTIIDSKPKGDFGGLDQYKAQNNLFEATISFYTLPWVEEVLESKETYAYYLRERSIRSRDRRFLLQLEPRFSFIKNLFEFYGNHGWVDIEQLYFHRLKIMNKDNIRGFHDTFEIIKSELKEYIGSLSNSGNENRHTLNSYHRHFFGNILNYNASFQSYEESSDKAKLYYFLNFNYTSFLRGLLEYSPMDIQNKLVINNVHGEIEQFPIIFGWGNETGADYVELERKGNEFLQNIKSTHYFNSTHYRDLEKHLNQPYEVYVYGLSCGLSDNILLKTIMRKSECRQIRIFFHKNGNEDNFRNTLMNISRVFDNKEDMRSKIISKQERDFIPQLKT